MRGLFGDRFLRRFTGDLKHRRKHPDSTGEGQNRDAGVDASSELTAYWSEAVRSDNHASEESQEVSGADAKNVPIKAEPDAV